MSHEHTVYDMCERCLGQGVVMGLRFEGKTMRTASQPCPNCEGLGILRETERTEVVSDEDDRPPA
jgi:DnaJ-class molecular chaperone